MNPNKKCFTPLIYLPSYKIDSFHTTSVKSKSLYLYKIGIKFVYTFFSSALVMKITLGMLLLLVKDNTRTLKIEHKFVGSLVICHIEITFFLFL